MEIETLSEYGARQALGEYRNFFVDNAFYDDGFFSLRQIEVSRTDDKNKFIIQMSDDGSTKIIYDAKIDGGYIVVTRTHCGLKALLQAKKADTVLEKFLNNKICLYHWELLSDADPDKDLSYEDEVALSAGVDLALLFPKYVITSSFMFKSSLDTLVSDFKNKLVETHLSEEDDDYEERLECVAAMDFDVVDRGQDILSVLKTKADFTESDLEKADHYYDAFIKEIDRYIGKPERIYTLASPIDDKTKAAFDALSFRDECLDLFFIKYEDYYLAVGLFLCD
ncbi:hypothetical protein SAMN02745229_02356 [Butyrivibrio fibrisolvens DSM 3071]|uniref:Uncharacterized protein n=1 Tax=Butyrivibrio fibrisolvens DSM 3071 TaxID=1121131 RepID=A0A1M5ZJP9_BUTFI|nr:hypothetical protein [Butyrivibrio fibrisolvens]SHI24517.1 hypothetical protein SAMN02745229_02356 [Butyrivibrio fibrisolvens DSM 3071]